MLAALAQAGEPITATAWDVRRDAEELLEDIAKRRTDEADLVARAMRMAEAHGGELVAAGPSSASPIATLLAERLATAGLSARFAEEAAAPAARRLAELAAQAASPYAYATLARSVPGTPSAALAWRHAADLAWDRGDLRLYRDAATAAHEGDDPLRRTRLSTAIALSRLPVADLPGKLDGLDAMWRISLENGSAAAAAANGEDSPRQGRVPARPSIAACGTSAVAICDGRSLLVADHLVGSALGRRLRVGSRPLPPHISRAASLRDGAVAVGIDEAHAVLVCSDAGGAERWRSNCGERRVRAVSAPLADGGLVWLAYRDDAGERDELRVLALRERDGSTAWDVPVASLGGSRWGDDDALAPALALHARGVVVLSNAGVLGLVGSDGAVRQLWSYPTRPLEPSADGPRRGRRGLAAGDGQTVVATPADHPGLVWILGPEDASPRAYRGDGADGDVVSAQDGEALLSGRQVALLDVARLRLRWTAPLRLGEAYGSLGKDNALVVGGDQLVVLERADGRSPGGRALRSPASVLAKDGMLVIADATEVRGFGDAAAFLSRLRQAADAAGGDPRPHAALASVLAGRGDLDAALSAWRRALDLGAGAEVAGRAAGVLRQRIDAGGPAAAAALADLGRLTPFLPGLDDELALWRGRLAEASGDRPAAAAAYRAAAAAADRTVTMPDGIVLSLRLLAESGMARCDPQLRAAPLALPVPSAAAPPAAAWRIQARTRGAALVSGGSVVAFADGLLRAWDVAQGRELWRRTPKRALLGVTEARGDGGGGVAITVLPGSAADACGLKTGDVLMTLNGQPLASFIDDLRPAVMALGGGARFRFDVRRGEEKLVVTGTLGGEPVEPLACDGGVLLARTTMPLAPGRSDLRFFAVDAATGADLWAHTLGASEERLARARPLLSPDGVVLAVDGPDLVGIAARTGQRLWTQRGRAVMLERATLLGRNAWLVSPDGDGVLLGLANGAELAALSGIDPEVVPVLGDDLMAARDTDGRLALWDLGRGRLRCRTAGQATPVAVRGDAVLAIDQRNRPVVFDAGTGAIRRLLGEDMVELAVPSAGGAALVLATPDRRRITAISNEGMGERWSLDLPPGIEVASLAASGTGLVASLREGPRAWVLLIDAAGQPAGALGWSSDTSRRGDGEGDALAGHGAIPAAGAAVVAEPGCLRVLVPGLPASPPNLRCLDLGAGPAKAALSPRLGDLAWGGDGERLALARSGFQLVTVVKAGTTEVHLRFSDTSTPLARDATLAAVTATGVKTVVPGAWSLAESWTVPAPGGDGVLTCALWSPLPSRTPGSPLLVQTALRGAATDLPWWLLSGWPRVAGPP